MPRRVSPKTLVLDLLRVAKPRAIPIRMLLSFGVLFGIKKNAMRVAVARLVRKAMVESDERGWYQLAPGTTALAEHIEDWRSGEKRVRAWRGDWLVVWLARGANRTERNHSVRALGMLGFREGLDGLFVRPNNLADSCDSIRNKLETLGLEPEAEHFVGDDFSPALGKRWCSKLYDTKKLSRSYKDQLASLRRSSAKVERMPLEQALVETFLLGGDAIRVLATDPLLPEQIAPCRDRSTLTETMIRYDLQGRRLWSRLFQAERDTASTPASSIATGNA